MTRLAILLLLCSLSTFANAAVRKGAIPVGVAQIDITPDYPIRLSGFGGRRTESEGVTLKIWAKALAFGDKEKGPAILITADNVAIPDEIVSEIARRLKKNIGLKRKRLSVTVSHTHTAAMLKNVCATLFGNPIPPEHQAHIDRYTVEFTDALEKVALAAVKDIRPARVSWGSGTVKFATNRRTAGGPVDHDLPVLFVSDFNDKVRAVYVSYACHCVTLSNNKISGDWAGFAQEALQKEFPGAVALTSVGCGADSNPSSGVTGDGVAVCTDQGRQVTDEVKRLFAAGLKPITAKPETRFARVDLPFAPARTRTEWEERARSKDYAVAYHAKVNLARLDRGETLPDKMTYPVQTWLFGDALAIIFMPGETVVDYALRLKREFDRKRLWVNGYANDSQCYVPSERILKEGGYEGGGAQIYYDRPREFAPGLEKKLIDAVTTQLPASFVVPKGTEGVRALSPDESLRDPVSIARFVLDEKQTVAAREAMIAANPQFAAELIKEMTQDLSPGTPEEYVRIPWIWRVAIGCGKRNDAEEIKNVLAVSTPKDSERLRDWQAVVFGGGIINGLSQRGQCPVERLAQVFSGDDALIKNVKRSLDLAATMADNEKIRAGTRYDALRMLGLETWEKRGAQLLRYLAKSTNKELQMGAVSAVADIPSPEAETALRNALPDLAAHNHQMALDALAKKEKSPASRGGAVKKSRLHIYLLMGQSNMVGHTGPEPEDRIPYPRVMVFTPGNQWEPAVDPLHNAGVGPGFPFGKTMAAQDTNVIIGLVPCAVGATLLQRWEKGGDLYSNAVARAKLAMHDGTLKGILWHQGEQDSILESDANSYHSRLAKMIADIRADLVAPALPFVVGQIGEFLYSRKQQTPFAKMINEALLKIPQDVPNTACVLSTGLGHMGDEVHFDTKSQRELGRRYAAEMHKLAEKNLIAK